MITLSIDENDPRILRLSASYLLALAGETTTTLGKFDVKLDVDASKLTKSIDTAIETFNKAELDEAKLIEEKAAGKIPTPADPSSVFGDSSPKLDVAPSTAAVDPLPTAPEVTTATTSIPTPPNVPLPPVASSDSAPDAVVTPPATPANDVELDERGLPWDGRIHSREKTKLKNGNWKNKRGVDAEVVTQVEAELSDLMSMPTQHSPSHTMTNPETVIPAPPPLASAEVAIAPVSTPVVPAPPVITAPPANLSSEPFPALMQKVTKAIAAGTLNNTEAVAIAAEHGVNGLALLIGRPDLIPAISAGIDAKIIENGGEP